MDVQPIAECSDYTGLIAALRARALELRIALGSQAAADISGLPDRYLTKLLGPKPVRGLGPSSLGSVLGLLGVQLVLVEDAESMRRFTSRAPRMLDRDIRSAAVTQITSRKFLSRIGRLGAIATNRVLIDKRTRRERWRIAKAKQRAAARAHAAVDSFTSIPEGA